MDAFVRLQEMGSGSPLGLSMLSGWPRTSGVSLDPLPELGRPQYPIQPGSAERGECEMGKVALSTVPGGQWRIHWQDCITVTRGIRSGKACIKGTCITAYDSLFLPSLSLQVGLECS